MVYACWRDRNIWAVDYYSCDRGGHCVILLIIQMKDIKHKKKIDDDYTQSSKQLRQARNTSVDNKDSLEKYDRKKSWIYLIRIISRSVLI